jgi:hypothetical protein
MPESEWQLASPRRFRTGSGTVLPFALVGISLIGL